MPKAESKDNATVRVLFKVVGTFVQAAPANPLNTTFDIRLDCGTRFVNNLVRKGEQGRGLIKSH